LPIRRSNRKASASAQRCSNEWNPPAHLTARRRDARERGDRRFDGVPCSAPTPHESRPSRPEQPLVAAGYEEVAAERLDGRVLDAETVHTVDTENVGASPPQRRSNPCRRQLDARTRMHPHDRDHPRPRPDAAKERRDDLVLGRAPCIPIERHASNGRARPRSLQAQRSPCPATRERRVPAS
jgi:hypothetical protein